LADDRSPSVLRLILVPALVTLAVTALRLTGELMGWSSLLYNRAAGGPGSLIGIVWLVPVFGFWFGWRLTRAGQGPGHAGRAAGYALLAVLAGAALGFAGAALDAGPVVVCAFFVASVVASVLLASRGWPALARVLLAYGLAARIPVALLMLAAIYGNWGTHYDVLPPGFDASYGPFARWVQIGLVPQLTIWIGFTVGVGGLLGALAASLARSGGAADRAALGQA
jgi:hypothetical protein